MIIAQEKFTVVEEKCCGCLQCMMICAITWTPDGSIHAARVKVERDLFSPYNFHISFKDSCKSSCTLCAQWCPYGAVQSKRGPEDDH